jgi:hypothetical protein
MHLETFRQQLNNKKHSINNNVNFVENNDDSGSLKPWHCIEQPIVYQRFKTVCSSLLKHMRNKKYHVERYYCLARRQSSAETYFASSEMYTAG